MGKVNLNKFENVYKFTSKDGQNFIVVELENQYLSVILGNNIPGKINRFLNWLYPEELKGITFYVPNYYKDLNFKDNTDENSEISENKLNKFASEILSFYKSYCIVKENPDLVFGKYLEINTEVLKKRKLDKLYSKDNFNDDMRKLRKDKKDKLITDNEFAIKVNELKILFNKSKLVSKLISTKFEKFVEQNFGNNVKVEESFLQFYMRKNVKVNDDFYELMILYMNLTI